MKTTFTKAFFVCFAFCLIQLTAMAQPTASFRSLDPKFGNGYDNNHLALANTAYQIDVVRAKVTGVVTGTTHTGTWPHEYVITHNNAHGNWDVLKENQVVMLFQGNQPSCSTTGTYLSNRSAHIFAWVSNNNTTTNEVTIRTDIPLNTTLIPTTISGTDKVQILRINNWTDAKFESNSSFTCAPWDGETGGIVAFMVSGKMTFLGDNVTIDASGKGFRGGNRDNNTSTNTTTYTAVKGTSTSLDATGGGGTLLAHTSPVRKRMDDGAGGCFTLTGSNGGFGTLMDRPIAADPPATQTERGCLANISTYINLGSGGYEGGAGEYGASAGGAGGYGGADGAGTAGTTGTDGTAADAGSSGYGGAGGVGGGIIYVYAYQYDYTATTTTNTIFLADGADAESGDDATGDGGDGGNGGNGADGLCSGGTYTIAGGNGQYGQGGNGADAGSGGDAGMPGYIRFFCNGAVNDVFIPSNIASAQPGFRGFGGEGTLKGANGTNGNDGADNLGSCLTCYPVNETLNEECNCAKALATIGDAGDEGGTLSALGASKLYSTTLNASFDNDLGDWKMDARWDATNSLLRVMSWEITQEGIPGGSPTAQEIEVNIYNCVLNDGSVDYDVFADLNSDLSNSADWDGDFSANGTSSFGPYQFQNDATPQEGDWYLSGGFKASASSCDLTGNGGPDDLPGDGPEDGTDGDGGKGREPAENPGGDRGGEDYSTDFDTENIIFQAGVAPLPPFVSLPQMDSVGFKALYPNPATSEFTLEVGDNDALDIEHIVIYGTDGKMIQKATYQVLAHNRLKIIELESLSKGSYLLQVITRDKRYSGNFTIQ